MVRVLEASVKRHFVCASVQIARRLCVVSKTSWNGPDCAEGHALVHSLAAQIMLPSFLLSHEAM